MKSDISTLFENCIRALDAGNCSFAHSFLEQAYPLLLNYPSKDIAWVYYFTNLACVYGNMGRFPESQECCLNAQRIIPLKGNEDLKAKVESTLACSYLNTGDFSKSFEHSNSALKLYNKVNNRENAALELITIGDILIRKMEWQQAIKCYSEALSVAKKIKNKKLESKTLMPLGNVFRGHRFLYLAIDHYREAERICKQINFNQGLVMALYERANTYLSLEMPDATFTLMKQVESLTPPDSTMRSFLYNLQYCIHNHNKNTSEALKCANLLLDFFQKAQDKRGEAESLEKIASSHYNLLEMDKAQYFGEKALKIAEEIGDKILQSICNQLFNDINYAIHNNINLDEEIKNEENDK